MTLSRGPAPYYNNNQLVGPWRVLPRGVPPEPVSYPPYTYIRTIFVLLAAAPGPAAETAAKLAAVRTSRIMTIITLVQNAAVMK